MHTNIVVGRGVGGWMHGHITLLGTVAQQHTYCVLTASIIPDTHRRARREGKEWLGGRHPTCINSRSRPAICAGDNREEGAHRTTQPFIRYNI